MMGPTGLAIAAIIGMQLMTLPAGKWLYAYDVRNAEQFCEALIPEIDAYKQKNGRYPEKITDVSLMTGDLPRLLRRQSSSLYHSDGKSFGFTFNDPIGMMNFISFNDKDRRFVDFHLD